MGTIRNDDRPSLSINDVFQNEGNAGTTTFLFTVSLSQPSLTPVTFDIVTADGTATAGSDYVARSLTSQTIPAGSASYTFDVTVNGDPTAEPNETFFVNITNVSGATLADAQGVGTILNDDSPFLSINDVSQNEGNAGTTTFSFTVRLSQPAPAGGVSFDIATANGNAIAGSDYVARALTNQFIAPGDSTYTFDVTVNGDMMVEPNETFSVNITNVSGATLADAQGVGTILNDDQPSLSITDVSQSEGNAGTNIFFFTVRLSQPSQTPVTFDIATADGTATAGSDYVAKSLTSQTIPAGSASYMLDVTVNGDSTVEPNETFSVNITNVNGATVADGQGLGTILNDDTDPCATDQMPPTITPRNITVYLNASGQASIRPFDVIQSVTDNCSLDSSSIRISDSTFSCQDVAPSSDTTTHLAYLATTSSGSQAYPGELGMEFSVNNPGGIRISQLGAFDHQSNGITGTQNGGIRVAIFSKATGAIVAGLDTIISGASDTLIANHRLRNITPVTLAPGSYVVVAKGYNAGELNGNAGAGSPVVAGDNASGAITFTGSGLYGNTGSSGFSYPGNLDAGPAYRYLAGTFRYDVVVDSSSTASGSRQVVISASDSRGNISMATAVVTVKDTLRACSSAGSSSVTAVAAEQRGEVRKAAAPVQVRLYPNPARDRFTLQLSGLTGTRGMIEVLNLNGQVLEQRIVSFTGKASAQTQAFSMSGQPSGVYFVRVKTEDGVRTLKVIVAR